MSGDPPGLAFFKDEDASASFRSFPPKPPPAMFDSSPSANARRSRTARCAARTACSPASPSSSVAIAARSARAEPVRGLAEPLRVAPPLLGKTRSGALRFLSLSDALGGETLAVARERHTRRQRLRREALRVGEEGAEHFSAKTTSPSSARTARGKSDGGDDLAAGVEIAEAFEVSARFQLLSLSCLLSRLVSRRRRTKRASRIRRRRGRVAKSPRAVDASTRQTRASAGGGPRPPAAAGASRALRVNPAVSSRGGAAQSNATVCAARRSSTNAATAPRLEAAVSSSLTCVFSSLWFVAFRRRKHERVHAPHRVAQRARRTALASAATVRAKDASGSRFWLGFRPRARRAARAASARAGDAASATASPASRARPRDAEPRAQRLAGGGDVHVGYRGEISDVRLEPANRSAISALAFVARASRAPRQPPSRAPARQAARPWRRAPADGTPWTSRPRGASPTRPSSSRASNASAFRAASRLSSRRRRRHARPRGARAATHRAIWSGAFAKNSSRMTVITNS